MRTNAFDFFFELADAAANVAALKETGAVGCNFEDQVVGGEGVHPLDAQAKRVRAIRKAVGDDFFINARTDLVIKAGGDSDPALIDQVIERGKAYADAGAWGVYVGTTPSQTDTALTVIRDELRKVVAGWLEI